jgi:hypothetical protein
MAWLYILSGRQVTMEVRIIIYSVLKGYDEEHKQYGKRGVDEDKSVQME